MVKFVIIFLGVFLFVSLFLLRFNFILQNSSNAPLVEKNVNNGKKGTEVTLLLGGDVMLGRSVTVESLDKQKNKNYPFEKLQNVFSESDIVFLNLETPIIKACPRRTDGMVFCAPSELLSGLVPEKTVLNLANNHTQNYGKSGLEETAKVLNEKGILATGIGGLVTKKIGETTFGFLGFDKDQLGNPTLTKAEEELVISSRPKVDVLIIAMHWGIEYNAHPTEGQVKLAKRLVELGADIVAGHHPHWVQDSVKIGNSYVYYSLGNLVFDQMWSEETKKGLMVKLVFEKGKIISEEKLPIYIAKLGQPGIVKE